jgi:3-deoxy-D-manno-octulosonic-acid transferase
MMGLLVGLVLYNLILAAAFLVGWPFLLAACLLPGGEKWRHRCGLVPRLSGRPLWIHAASMGEAALIPPLAEALGKSLPSVRLAVSTMTQTGRQRASRLVHPGASFFLPLDFPMSVLLALSRVRPLALVLMETELWPNLIWLATARGIPVVIANARLSEKSLPWYRAFSFLFRPLLGRTAAIACQSSEYSRRYRSLGIEPGKAVKAGNIKFDSIRGPAGPGEKMVLRRKFGLGEDDLVLVAGSTRPGEEEVVLEAWIVLSSRVRLILAPRHPDRFDQVERLLSQRGVAYARRSRLADFPPGWSVLLLDTMGELVEAYAAGDIALVGGSFVPVGGHNPLEPAALGLPVVFGPHMFNARESARILVEAGGAAQAQGPDQLAEILMLWAKDPAERRACGERARQAVEGRRGASTMIAGIIKELITQGEKLDKKTNRP